MGRLGKIINNKHVTNNVNKNNINNSKSIKCYKKLNKEQIRILKLIYEFRFVQAKHVASYLNKQSIRSIQKQLKVLENQKLIAKRYDTSYKLRGKPASYYLLPSGARSLDINPDTPVNFKRLYREKDRSEDFISHCLHILDAYLGLERTVPEKGNLVYVTKIKLDYDIYDYFPRVLPDAYIRIKRTRGSIEFFLDIFEEKEPYFVLVRRVKHYFAYREDGGWGETGTSFPIILLVCSGKSIQKRLNNLITRELRNSYETIIFATTTIAEIAKLSNEPTTSKIWHVIDSESYDSDEPIGLEEFQLKSSV